MNKAFIKEPESTGRVMCPVCGSLGDAVGPETLAAHLSADALRNVASNAYFCPLPTCSVAYFDEFGRAVNTGALRAPVYPKDPEAPICACFGFHSDDIEQDLTEGVVTRVRALLEQAKSPAARCATQAANGHNCVAEVQRYYMKRRAERSAGGPGS